MRRLPLSRAVPALVLALAGTAPYRAPADCSHLDDPFQVLDLHLEMDPADWAAVLRDVTWEDERPGRFRCGDEAPLAVMVRRKRGGAMPADGAPVKVSLKIDFDDPVEEGEWHGRRKISLEAGIRQPIFALVKEGLAWQLMNQAGAVAGGAAWARLSVNGAFIGVYTRAEQVDKSFLRRRLGDDEGFLYKLDLSTDGRRVRVTREGEPDPYERDLCFPPFGEGCAAPGDGLAVLKQHLDIRQLLTVAAVNSFIANTDGPLEADNNYFWYNSERPRVYFPWDLDLGMREENVAHGPHVSEMERLVYAAAPELRAEADRILGRLIHDPFAPEVLEALLDGLAAAVGPAIESDPLSGLPGGFTAEVERLRSWLRRRVSHLKGRLPPPRPFPLVINEVLASNAFTGTDEGGEAADWVELYNRGPGPVSTGGLYLSDDPAAPRRWALPAVSIPPGGRLLIWCDRDLAQGPLHTGFQLNADGEAVGLYAEADGLIRAVDFVWFRPQETDVSLGRLPDGAPGFRRLACPTPAAENRADCPGEEPFIRGDAAAGGRLDLTDAVGVLLTLYFGAVLECERAADADDDEVLAVADVVAILSYLFLGGSPPPAPFPGCGRDLSPGGLGCGSSTGCAAEITPAG